MMMTAKRYTHNPLKYYKLSSSVKDPVFATEGSACFDLHAFIPVGTKIKVYTSHGKVDRTSDPGGNFLLEKGHRALIPTGLIFDIPLGWAVKLYARSGTALKKGLSLANSVGVIDSDYVDPVFAILENKSNHSILIKNESRICQAQMEMVRRYHLEEIHVPPLQKTDRDGGFGSTGTK